MSPEPTGEVERTDSGRDLILTRILPVDSGEAWAWVTESPKLEKWFGTWTGEQQPGSKILVTMNAEEKEVTSDGVIEACDPGSSYEVKVIDDYGSWHLELRVESSDSGSRLVFVHHLDDEANLGQVGPGWEYYLDRLLAAINGTTMPDFDDYYPPMESYYAERG